MSEDFKATLYVLNYISERIRIIRTHVKRSIISCARIYEDESFGYESDVEISHINSFSAHGMSEIEDLLDYISKKEIEFTNKLPIKTCVEKRQQDEGYIEYLLK